MRGACQRPNRWCRWLLVGLAAAGCSRAPDEAPPAPPAADLDPARPLPSPIPDVVARVNGQPIRIEQILPIARAELVKVPVEEREARRAAVVRLALRRYIDRELLLQEALARGLEANARALERAYDQARRDFPDPAEWAEHLAETGLDEESFKAELRLQHTVAALLAAEGGGFEVTDDEARRAYEADPMAWSVESDEPPPFEAVADRVRAALRGDRRAEVTARLLGELRAKARITTFL